MPTKTSNPAPRLAGRARNCLGSWAASNHSENRNPTPQIQDRRSSSAAPADVAVATVTLNSHSEVRIALRGGCNRHQVVIARWKRVDETGSWRPVGGISIRAGWLDDVIHALVDARNELRGLP